MRYLSAALGIVALLFVLGPTSSVAAQPERLVVATVEIEPFIERNGDRADGFFMEIWDDVADDLGVDYDVVWADSFAEMLAFVEAGDADVAVAPLAPTAEREARLDFSSAVIRSGPKLGVHERVNTGGSLLGTLLGSGALRVLLFAFLGLVVLGHIIWLVERHGEHESDFHPNWPAGVLDGMWWAAATVTTVGYGDMAPKSTRGRIVGLLAMLASLFLVGAFVSQVTADLSDARRSTTVKTLTEIDGAAVGSVSGSSFEFYLIAEGVNVRGYKTQGEVFEAAAAGEVDFVVANPFALEVLGPQFGLTGVGDVFYEEFETFGLTQDSPWREPINQSLADLQVTGQVQRIVDRWLAE